MATERVETPERKLDRERTGYAINALKVRNRQLEDQLAVVRAFLDLIESDAFDPNEYPSAPTILIKGLKYVIRREPS